MEMNRILVLGGTGLLGEPTVRQLESDGYSVRLLVRDPARVPGDLASRVDLAVGDVADLASLRAAMDDCDGVHISVGGAFDRISVENVATLAPESGVARITYVSGSTVSDANAWFPMVEQKVAAEKALAAGRTAWTVFCPTWPMEQLPRFVIGGRASVIGEQATPLHWFAAADLGRMVSAAFQKESAVGKRLYVHGPEGMNMKSALERYCAAFHPEIEEVSVLPLAVARSTAEATGDPTLAFMTEMMAYFDQAGELGDPSLANELLGAPQTTLASWIDEQRASDA